MQTITVVEEETKVDTKKIVDRLKQAKLEITELQMIRESLYGNTEIFKTNVYADIAYYTDTQIAQRVLFISNMCMQYPCEAEEVFTQTEIAKYKNSRRLLQREVFDEE